jgi:hypothetical protein
LIRHRTFCEDIKHLRITKEWIPTVLEPLIPWARHYRGSIVREKGKIIDRGIFEQRGGKIVVSEIPIAYSYEQYVEKLNEMKDTTIVDTSKKPKEAKRTKKLLKSHTHESYHLNANGDDRCRFELREFSRAVTHKNLKLQCTICTSMMTVFDDKGKLVHYDGPEELLMHYSEVMIDTRETLRLGLVAKATEKYEELSLKLQFVEEVIADPTLVAGRKDAELLPWMEERGYPKTFLKMPLRSITDKLRKKTIALQELEAENLEHYSNIHAEDLWLEQLTRFEEEYAKMYEQ